MSNNNKYTSVDELIKESLRERAEKEKDIDIDAAWEKFNKRYNTKPKKFPKAITIASSILLVLVSAIVLLPNEGSALNLKIFESIKSFITGKAQVAHISFSQKDKKKDTVDSLKPEVASVLKDVPYDVLLPLDMMDQYSIEKAQVRSVGDSTKVTFFLNGPNSVNVTISQVDMIGEFNQGNTYDTEDATMKKININGQDASLFVYKNDIKRLCWVDRDTFITISGPLSEDEILILANSLRRINLQ